MQRGHHKGTVPHSSVLELPEGFDPSGIPSLDAGYAESPLLRSHRAGQGSLPGLAPAARIATVHDVASEGTPDWLLWGCVEGRPMLFSVEAAAAAEMIRTVRRGEEATAIVEPGQVLVERLD